MLLHDFRNAIQFARRVERRRLVQIVQYVHPHIEADHVDQPETGALGQADQRPGQRVHFFHAEIELFGEPADFRAEETPDAIADEVGSILARHDAFAEVQIAECRDPVQDVAARFLAGDHLGEMEIARGIEEVRSQKVLPEVAIEALGDEGQRNSAGVGGDNRPRRAQGGDAAPQRAFDVEILRHGFDDPLAAADAAQIVLEIPRRDQGLGGIGEKGHGPLLGCIFDSGQRRGVPLGLVGQHDIQKVHGKPGIGEVGGDARAHSARPQDRDTA